MTSLKINFNKLISFRLFSDQNQLLKTVGNGDARQAIAGVYGVEAAKKMKAIEASNFDFTVSGYVSLPELTRASKSYLTLVVNGRHIKNYALSQAIVDGYSSKLMVGRYPMALVNIEMDRSSLVKAITADAPACLTISLFDCFPLGNRTSSTTYFVTLPS